jgi:hypothetical protein
MIRIVALLCLLVSPAFAQEMPPIDRDLWQLIAQSLAGISMPLQAHQQAQQLLQNVEQEAMRRAAAKAAQKPKDP